MRRHIAALAALAVVMSACSGSDGDSQTGSTASTAEAANDTSSSPAPTTTSDSTGDQDATTDAGAPTTGGRATVAPLDWAPCDDVAGLECATLAVPLDHAEPDGTMIDLAVARLVAPDRSDRVGSLVFNPGGPGGSGLEFLQFAQFTVPTNVSDVFDLVSFDPRGVGASASIDCDLTLDDGIDLIGDDDRAAWDGVLERLRGELATCSSDTDDLAQYVGTNNAARDLDRLREALGDEQLSYVGFSYGTRLGATYAELFPERVRALVLDGAVKPTDDFTVIGAEQGGGFDRAYGNFAAACDADSDCLIRELGSTTDVVDAVRAEIAEVGSFDTDDPERQLTPGELELGIIASLYSKQTWPFLAQAVYLAETGGDGTLFQVLADTYLGRQPDGSYTNQTEAGSFINCADNPSRPTADEVWEQTDRVADASTSFGASLRAGTGCLGIEPAADPITIGTASGAAPILVIGTTGDPATPYEWSVEMADLLESGVLFTVEGEGHTAYTSIPCVEPVVEAYLVDLEVPEPESSCVDDTGTDFFVPAGESEFDQALAFFECLVEEGAPIEPVTTADLLADPTGEEIFADVDLTDPDLQSALFACSDLLPT